MIESVLYPLVCKINTYLSNYILVILLIGVGLWYSIRTRFVQVRCFGEGMRKVFDDADTRLKLLLSFRADELEGLVPRETDGSGFFPQHEE